jgi:prepilin-type N-terminal cleavage/methylation domain-containing protein
VRGRSRERGDDGVTLVEMAVTVMLLGIVLAMVVQVMISVQSSVELESGRSTRNDRLRLAVRAIERQIRSGEVVADPATENDAGNDITPGMSMRIRMQGTGAAGAIRCAQWRVTTTRLETREWSPQWAIDGDVTGWRIVAEGIANRAAAPTVTAFRLASAAAYARRVVEIDLTARGDASEANLQRVQTSITGRNAVVGAAPPTTCDSLPPY